MLNWLRVKQAWRDWLRIRGDYDRFPDSFALTEVARDQGLVEAIRQRRVSDQAILVLTHFPETFEHVQSLLDAHSWNYEIGPLRLAPETILEPLLSPASTPLILLALASTLDQSALDRRLPVQRKFRLSMMVVERHPVLAEDRRIELFARTCPCTVQLGYLLSLEDPIIGRLIQPATIQVLKQFGLREQDLVTSRMVSRVLDKILHQYSARQAEQGTAPAAGGSSLQSATDWLDQLDGRSPGPSLTPFGGERRKRTSR